MPGPLLARGRTAEVYVWQAGQVLKLFYDWCQAHCAQREIEAARVVSARGLPTPRLIDTVELGGRLGLVYERADGPVVLDWLTAQQGHPAADVARTLLLLRIGQVPDASPAQKAFINLWRGLFHRAYLARILARYPAWTRAELETWLIPMAAARLNERIAGEEARLLPMIRSGLALRQSARTKEMTL